jgi:hypothetical protein
VASPMSDDDNEDITVTPPRDRVVMLDGGVVLHSGGTSRASRLILPSSNAYNGGQCRDARKAAIVIEGRDCFICGGAQCLALD